MKEFIDKLIERLEEKQDEYFHGKSDYEEGKYNAYDEVAQIVNQLAESYHVHCEQEYMRGYSDAKNEIEEEHKSNLSENLTGWIACSERLPEEEGKYLVTLSRWNVVTFSNFKNVMGYKHFDNGYVLAWMPLPPAYMPKGE